MKNESVMVIGALVEYVTQIVEYRTTINDYINSIETYVGLLTDEENLKGVNLDSAISETVAELKKLSETLNQHLEDYINKIKENVSSREGLDAEQAALLSGLIGELLGTGNKIGGGGSSGGGGGTGGGSGGGGTPKPGDDKRTPKPGGNDSKNPEDETGKGDETDDDYKKKIDEKFEEQEKTLKEQQEEWEKKFKDKDRENRHNLEDQDRKFRNQIDDLRRRDDSSRIQRDPFSTPQLQPQQQPGKSDGVKIKVDDKVKTNPEIITTPSETKPTAPEQSGNQTFDQNPYGKNDNKPFERFTPDDFGKDKLGSTPEENISNPDNFAKEMGLTDINKDLAKDFLYDEGLANKIPDAAVLEAPEMIMPSQGSSGINMKGAGIAGLAGGAGLMAAGALMRNNEDKVEEEYIIDDFDKDPDNLTDL